MDQKELQQKIAQYYTKLPEELQIFFASQNWLTSIKEISAKYKLNQEQISTLTTETTLLLLCITSTEDYIKLIETELKLSTETFETLLGEIGETILKDIYQKLDEGFINNLQELDKENKAEMQDVPLPPYKKQEEISKIETTPEKKTEVYATPTTKVNVIEQKLVDQTKKDVNFLAQKLNNPTITPTTVSDHSLPNINKQTKNENPLAKSHDPYREGVEL